MTLRPVQCVELVCDRCEDRFEYGDYTIFGDGWDVADCAADSDWWMGEARDDDQRGPEGKHLCPGCYTVEWVDDDTVQQFTERPIPEPHVLVRNPRFTSWPPAPFELCKADGCGLKAKHAVHKAGAA